MIKPKVSVALITYNHSKFITAALESVLAQEADFPFEIVVGDDCSTDDTMVQIQRYKQVQLPIIRILKNKKNLGVTGNWARTIQACSGKYIALLEGDDYWTSFHKLQKQADFLDLHPECSVCFHNANVSYETEKEETHPFYLLDRVYPISRVPPKQFSTIQDIIKGNFIITCTTMFRAGLFHGFPDWFFRSTVSDWPLHIMNARYGTLAFIDEVMSVYRIHNAGTWSSGSIRDQNEILLALAENIDQFVDPEHRKVAHENLVNRHLRLARICLLEADMKKAAFHARRAILKSKFGSRFTAGQLRRALFLSLIPRIYARYRELRSRTR